MKNNPHLIVRIFLIFTAFILHGCIKSKAKEVNVVTEDEMKTHLQYIAEPETEINLKEDFKKSNIVNADKLIEDEKLRADLEILEKDSPIAIYFTSENKTQEAAKILSNMGFKQIYILNNGIREWKPEN